MGDDAATVEQLRAELREFRRVRDLYEAAQAEIDARLAKIAGAYARQ